MKEIRDRATANLRWIGRLLRSKAKLQLRLRPTAPYEPRKRLRICFDLTHFEALCLIEEEEFIRVDFLARLLGIPLTEAREVTELCTKLNLVRQRRILVHEDDPWTSLTENGLLTVGSKKRTSRHFPSLGKLASLEARAAVRTFLTESPQRSRIGDLVHSFSVLAVDWMASKAGYSQTWKLTPGELQSEDARWELGINPTNPRHRDAPRRLADAFVEVDGRRTAILIGRFAGRPRLTTEALLELGQIVDSVCCFCLPEARVEVEEAVEEHGLMRVQIADMPELSGGGYLSQHLR